jgi:hypothetical protein
MADLTIQRSVHVLEAQIYGSPKFVGNCLTQLGISGTPKFLKRVVLDGNGIFGTKSDVATASQLSISDHDFDDQIADALQKSVDGTPCNHQHQVKVWNASALVDSARYQEIGGLSILENAISETRKAIEELGQTDSKFRPVHGTIRAQPRNSQVVLLSNLGIHLECMYRTTAHLPHLSDAIKNLRIAVNAANHVLDRAHLIHILGLQLRDRYVKNGDRMDLNEAISSTREALESLPFRSPNNCNRIALLNKLASLLADKFTDEKTPNDGNDALRLMNEALQSLQALEDETLVKRRS